MACKEMCEEMYVFDSYNPEVGIWFPEFVEKVWREAQNIKKALQLEPVATVISAISDYTDIYVAWLDDERLLVVVPDAEYAKVVHSKEEMNEALREALMSIGALYSSP
ncbi:MAG: hypothetical protein J7K15_10370 [Deltaproteobacteria bacterium]|nr:hypothetical protein [Deltaproteobacteria bacterium]